MKQRIILSGFLLFASACTPARNTTESTSAAVIYPAPSGESPSPLYEVRVIDGSNVGHSSFVYFDSARRVTTPGNHGTDLMTGRSFSWTTFEIEGPVKVQVVRLVGGFDNVKIRPSRMGLKPTTINTNTIEFTMSPGQKVSVEFDTAMGRYYYDKMDVVRDILTVFADKKEAGSPVADYNPSDVYRPSPGSYAANATISGISAPVKSTMGNAQNKKVVVFGPGVYTIGYWQVPNNVEHIHIEGGAIVYGAIEVLPMGAPPKPDDYLNVRKFTLRDAFKVTGHGILSGKKIPWHTTMDLGYCPDAPCGWWKTIKLLRMAVTNGTVTDVTFADSPDWVLRGAANGADSRSTGVFRNFKIVAQWAFNNDGLAVPRDSRVEDCFIQAYDDTFNLTNSGSRIDNCVVWQFGNGGSFQMGWFAKSVSNIQVTNIDVIHGEWWWGEGNNLGFLNYAKAGGAGLITDVHFTNINIEDTVLRLIGLNPEAGQRIENITFTNVRVGGWGNDPFNSGRHNWLNANNGGSIKGITFSGLQVGDQPVTNSNYSAIGRFQFNGKVSNILFTP